MMFFSDVWFIFCVLFLLEFLTIVQSAIRFPGVGQQVFLFASLFYILIRFYSFKAFKLNPFQNLSSVHEIHSWIYEKTNKCENNN